MGDHPIFESIDELVKTDRLPKGYTAGKFLQGLNEKNLDTLAWGAIGILIRGLPVVSTPGLYREEEVSRLSQVFYFLEHKKKLHKNVREVSIFAFMFSAMIMTEYCVRQEYLRYRGEFSLREFDPKNCWWLPAHEDNAIRKIIDKWVDGFGQNSAPGSSLDNWEERFIGLTRSGALRPGSRLGNYLRLLEDDEIQAMCHVSKLVLREIVAAQRGKIAGQKTPLPSREAVVIVTLAELMAVVEQDDINFAPLTNTTVATRFCVGVILEALKRDGAIQLMSLVELTGKRPSILAPERAIAFLEKHVGLDHFIIEDMIDIHKIKNNQQGEAKNELQ